jgi:beta-glucosidase
VAISLLGDLNPCGKLTLSWPHHVGQQPVRYDQALGAHQSAYPDLPGVGFDPLFAFGFGLSYTSIRYRWLRLGAKILAAGEALVAKTRVANNGLHAVDEIVQAYLHDRYTSVVWPAKKLKAWTTIHLEPGEEHTVTFTFPYADLELCDAAGE